MVRSKDRQDRSQFVERASNMSLSPRVIRTGRREEDNQQGDGWFAIGSLLLLVSGVLMVSYLIFSV